MDCVGPVNFLIQDSTIMIYVSTGGKQYFTMKPLNLVDGFSRWSWVNESVAIKKCQHIFSCKFIFSPYLVTDFFFLYLFSFFFLFFFFFFVCVFCSITFIHGRLSAYSRFWSRNPISYGNRTLMIDLVLIRFIKLWLVTVVMKPS